MGRDSSDCPSCAPSRSVASSECFSGPGSRPREPTAGSLTRYERDTVQRMLERGASCKPIVRSLGRSPSMANSEVLEGGLLYGLRNDLGGQEVDGVAELAIRQIRRSRTPQRFPRRPIAFHAAVACGCFQAGKASGSSTPSCPARCSS